MNSNRFLLAWGLAVVLHAAGAAGLGWLASLAPPEMPVRVDVAAVEMLLVNDSSAMVPRGGSAGEPVPPPPPEPVVQEEPDPEPEPEPEPEAPVEVLTVPDEAAPEVEEPEEEVEEEVEPEAEVFEEELEELVETEAEMVEEEMVETPPEQPESRESPADPGSGENPEVGFGADVRAASARAVIKPVYPLGARRRGEEGRVCVELTVLEDGSADAVEVVESSGYADLDRAAERAVRRAKFVAARRGAREVESRIRLSFIFELRD